MLCISVAYAVMRYLSVRLTVCLSSSWILSKGIGLHISSISSPSGSHTVEVFPYQTLWQYSDGDPLTEASNAGGLAKIAILSQYLAPSRPMNGSTAKCDTHCDTAATNRAWQVDDTHHHHHQVARPAVSIAVSTTERHLERSCARSHAKLRPRLVGCRSDSKTVAPKPRAYC